MVVLRIMLINVYSLSPVRPPENIDMGVMACLCMMAITMMLITGVLKGKPSHLLPFFSVQLFDFAVTT